MIQSLILAYNFMDHDRWHRVEPHRKGGLDLVFVATSNRVILLRPGIFENSVDSGIG